MINVVITENSSEIIEGVPEVFVEDENFTRILNDREFALSIRNYFNRDICIGRLGNKISEDLCSEPQYVEKEIELGFSEGMSFYEKIS